ncbi:prenyltransferase/squalene oxidase repeat-containing protein [Conexibacter stalactiti]|uniref:Prenyltransferase/squalene oxidase repeat-containing protein n=1 Tax=Conexibacter stalactiti TaxID=1940611 RepID=A0ABU4HLN2_9ACTN|nr:prenyltransferase/squalene oxidase repeat-containing protein [Conexibacter stalactiti]MDW5594218.1 prenyltransferase/squalene oxidase repeat-containing protein [Conexibacter stalactiti]MEC5034860.1 prenyltransferase/squalene oxidase repeat-containing protein [Conexibacter stalactiti]
MPPHPQVPQRARAAPRRPSALVLLLVLLAATVAALSLLASGPAPAQSGDRVLDGTVAYMQQHQRRDGCFPMVPGGEADPVTASPWTALALAAAGVNPREQFRPDGYRSVFDCIEAAAGQLANTTDLERTLLVVNAAGTDPRAFGGVDLVAGILRQQRDSGAFSRTFGSAGADSPVNTTVFAILSLSLVREPAVEAAIGRAADWLLTAQNDSGSWSDVAAHTNESTDMTGAALQALRAAGRVGAGAGTEHGPSRAAVDRALAWLRTLQRDDGGFPLLLREQTGNSGSTAWVAQGLWAVGEDPRAWVRSGRSMLDFLASLQRDDGHIAWKADNDASPMWMTSYSLPAYSGRYLPIAAIPPSGRSPDPRNAPSPERPAGGTGGGSGGDERAPGGGVLAGGGGEGAPNFSRPRPDSKGATIGGVRQTRVTRATPRRGRERTQAQQDRDAADSDPGVADEPDEPDAAPAPESADEPGAAPGPGDGRDASQHGDSDGGERVTGLVVGGGTAAGADGGALAGAYGLRGAERGGDTGPQLALAIATALLMAAAGGGLWERRLTT